MTDDVDTSSGWRGKLAAGALIFSIFVALWFVAAGLGTKFGLWDWKFGLGTMTVAWGPKLAFGALGLSAIALIISLIKAPRKKPFMLAGAALLVAIMPLGRLISFGAQVDAVPPIHDVSTDWQDPIMFSAEMMDAREADGAENAVEAAPIIPEAANGRWPGFGGRLVSEVQEEAERDPTASLEEELPYPQLDTIMLDASVSDVLTAAQAVIDDRGWDRILTEGAIADEIQIEATHTSGGFGFKDDVAVRIRKVDGGTEVDMRSVSRVGFSDLGANAVRIDAFLTDLKREVR